MTIPKKVRKRAKRAIRAAAHPFVRDFATAAMAAAGRVRRERAEERQEDVRMCHEYKVHIDGSKLAEAFRKAALAGLRTFMEGLEQGLREARGSMNEPQPKPRAKPKPGPKARPKAKASAAKPKAASSRAKPRPRAPRA